MFNQSLNAGLDFDTDLELVPQIVETIGTGVAPEFDEEVVELFSMEERVEDLLVLRREIEEQRGMSQALAMEGLRILPDFGGKAPVAYYSVQPTSTRLKVSLESIGKGIWILIAAGIAAVIAVIYKIFKWLSGDDKPTAENAEAELERKAKQAEKAAEEFEKASKELRTAMHAFENRPYRIKPDSEYAGEDNEGIFTMQRVIDTFFRQEARDQRVLMFLSQRDPVFHDIVSKGEYSQEMTRVAPLFSALKLVMQQRIALLQEIAERDLKQPNFAIDKMKNVAALKPLLQPMEVEYDGRKMTLNALSSEITNLRASAEGKQAHEDLNFDKLFGVMEEAFKSANVPKLFLEMRAVVTPMATMREHLTQMEVAAKRFSVDGAEGAHSTTIGSDLRHAIFVMGKDLADLQAIMAQVQYYTGHLSYLAVQAVAFAEEVARKVVAHLEDEDKKPPASWKQAVEQLRSYRKRLQELR
ncbi:hypothetical protein AWB81_04245 [Caballeronia arationis]|uniref:hypothetical protein n=1 Tax=Caballeronia arationis TaxID=1777142 RepID=UPI00074C4FD2|nr:hypothetical protein [Caballeronia arationis]SAK83861.1 hypothetical protein AWB81_04245 [Caballeronia arationis]